jgi:hypothetical protein
MDFVNRSAQNQSQSTRATAPQSVVLPAGGSKNDKKHEQKMDFIVLSSRIGTTILLFVVALLVGSAIWLIHTAEPLSESKYLDPQRLQAVFLNTGQVYFGNVQTLNRSYLVLSNVFYLQTNGKTDGSAATSSNSQVSLVKLGCELHMPYDRMVINSTQVTFWENLQNDGQVAKAVAQYDKQNPDGQKCSDQGQAPNGNNVQGQNTTSNPSTNSTKP